MFIFSWTDRGNSQNQLSYDNYWKETVYADDASYETAELPEIENMNVTWR